MRKDLPVLIEKLTNIPGIEDIAMTTNGTLLPLYADQLKRAGLNRVTISLDSLNPDRFKQMNGRHISIKKCLMVLRLQKRLDLLSRLIWLFKKV